MSTKSNVPPGVNPKTMEQGELSALFAEAGWTQSDRNFEPRPFVLWHGSFFSVAGTPPNGEPVAKACKTQTEVIAFLEEQRVLEKTETVNGPANGREPHATADSGNADPAADADTGAGDRAELDAELERTRKERDDLFSRVKELEARPPVVVPPSTDPLGEELEKARRANRQMVGGVDERASIPNEIAELMEPGETLTQARKRLSELLNVEKAELRLKRAAGSATDAELKREADVDRLQGLFSKLGEI
jgi:hypothetical protein